MKVHKHYFIGLTLLISALMFTSSSVYAVKRLKTYGLPVLPAYKKNDRVYLYFAVSSPPCTYPSNRVVIDGAVPSSSDLWWKVYWCDTGRDNNDGNLVVHGAKNISPGTHKFRLQGVYRGYSGSSNNVTTIAKFKKTFSPGEFWVLWTEIDHKGISYGLLKLGKCGRAKQFGIPPKSDKPAYNKYRILSFMVKDINSHRKLLVNGTRWEDLSFCK